MLNLREVFGKDMVERSRRRSPRVDLKIDLLYRPKSRACGSIVGEYETAYVFGSQVLRFMASKAAIVGRDQDLRITSGAGTMLLPRGATTPQLIDGNFQRILAPALVNWKNESKKADKFKIFLELAKPKLALVSSTATFSLASSLKDVIDKVVESGDVCFHLKGNEFFSFCRLQKNPLKNTGLHIMELCSTSTSTGVSIDSVRRLIILHADMNTAKELVLHVVYVDQEPFESVKVERCLARFKNEKYKPVVGAYIQHLTQRRLTQGAF